ncbi:MAG: zinc-ribbon domain-containing protein [Syntrophobacteraceae bacterium]|nr:zinc-ribbon domain-containing protein [Syntrophobacteraceae bacterium]
MIVTCESCKTKFRLDPTRLKGPRTKVRCSRCGHMFSVSQPEEEVLIHIDLSEDAVGLEDQSTRHSTPSSAPALPGIAKAPSSKKKLLWILPLALLAGGVAYFLTGSPSKTPPGPSSSPTEIKEPVVSILDTTHAYFLDNLHVGQIFVVEGEIVNESSKPVSFVLLEGKLYKRDNKVAQSQRCYAGNSMNRKELVQFNATELQNRMMNREGKDLSNVNIQPSRRVPFMLVFHNLPDMDLLGDYSVEVVSSKFD